MARPRKFDEQAVLTAARSTFWRDGYAATSVQDLTDATGVGTQSLYGAFGNKHDLFVRILEDYCARQSAGLEAAMAADPSPWHGLASAVTFEDGGRLDLPPQGCLMANSAAALSSRDEQVKAMACQAYTGTLELFARQIDLAKAAGEIDAGIDAEQTARALIAVMQGIEFLHKSGIGDDELRRAKSAVLQMIDSALAR
ncbi:TetR family transcriptional regulator C-terminal domain-containing protein [Nocardia salmonicida]|uniref:TetR family transcriptional regulator C-terminal domain-containing protein n=1 Tax=Nocardia salmonicida TaxID=53431 RepID=UPI00379E659C